ncbi:MAG TPA: hypothetical protein DEP51_06900 [Clostridiales bacterium]|nr:hypothetical protein [Clostridiales bacterium]
MKYKKESFFKGIAYLLISQIFIKIIGFVYKFYLTNKNGFGDTGNAIYSSGFQIYALLLAFSSTGIPSAISKLVSERLAVGDSKGAHKIFKIAFISFALIGGIVTIVLFLSAKKISKDWIQIPEAEKSLICLAPSVFFVSIISVFRGYFNGRQNFSLTAKSQGLEQIFKTVLTVLLVEITSFTTNSNVTNMAGAANLATTIATMLCAVYILLYYIKKRREIGQEINQSINYRPTRIRKTIKTIFKQAIPISLSSIISSFNRIIDSFTVVRLLKKSIDENNARIQYGVLSGKIDILCSLALSLNIPFVTAFIPRITKTVVKGDYHKIYESINAFLCITFLIGIPITILFFIFPDKILNILFPNANSGALYLKISSICIIFSLLNQTINAILQSLGKENVPPLSGSVGIIIKLVCNVFLIPNEKLGILGAIIGNIISNVISCLISGTFLTIQLRKQTRQKQ